MDVKYVADLAKIKLTDGQIKKLEAQFTDILSFFEDLKEVKTENIEPCSHILTLKNVFRQDVIKPSLSKEDALENAPQKSKDFIEVPRVIKE